MRNSSRSNPFLTATASPEHLLCTYFIKCLHKVPRFHASSWAAIALWHATCECRVYSLNYICDTQPSRTICRTTSTGRGSSSSSSSSSPRTHLPGVFIRRPGPGTDAWSALPVPDSRFVEAHYVAHKAVIK